jgi:predicted RNA-binding protein with RPS1 domain
MKLPGIVTNITAFGAFVDIGVHQDGLVHLSQIADRYVKDPGEILKVRQVVEVTVLAVDLERKRISLTMKTHPDAAGESAVKPKGKARIGKEGGSAGEKPPKPRAERPRKEKPASDGVPLPGAERRDPPREKIVEVPPRREEPPKKIQPRQDKGKPDHPRSDRGRARNEKVPFNNPFVAVFGKKLG